MHRRALLIDRDGTVCEDVGYLDSAARLRLLPGAAWALAEAARAGFQTVLITNQAGVGHGRFDELVLDEIHDRLRELLAAEGARLDGIYYCPHHPEAALPRYRLDCACRKPKPGMLREIGIRFGVDMSGVPCVGDGLRDLLAAEAVGGQPMLVLTGKGEKTLREGSMPKNTVIFPDLAFAAAAMLAND